MTLENSTHDTFYLLGEDGEYTQITSTPYTPYPDPTVDQWCEDWRRANDGESCPDRGRVEFFLNPLGEEKMLAYLMWFVMGGVPMLILSSRMDRFVNRYLGYKVTKIKCVVCDEVKDRKVAYKGTGGGRLLEGLHENSRPCLECRPQFPKVMNWLEKAVLKCEVCDRPFVIDWTHPTEIGYWKAVTTIPGPKMDKTISKTCPECLAKEAQESAGMLV